MNYGLLGFVDELEKYSKIRMPKMLERPLQAIGVMKKTFKEIPKRRSERLSKASRPYKDVFITEPAYWTIK